MDTATDTTPETYPWDRTEPWVPAASVSLFVVGETVIDTFDYLSPESSLRAVGLRFGELTLYIGVGGGDTEVVVVIDRLLEPLQELRSAALRRLAKP